MPRVSRTKPKWLDSFIEHVSEHETKSKFQDVIKRIPDIFDRHWSSFHEACEKQRKQNPSKERKKDPLKDFERAAHKCNDAIHEVIQTGDEDVISKLRQGIPDDLRQIIMSNQEIEMINSPTAMKCIDLLNAEIIEVKEKFDQYLHQNESMASDEKVGPFINHTSSAFTIMTEGLSRLNNTFCSHNKEEEEMES